MCKTNLRDRVVKLILRRQESGARHRSPKKGRGSSATIGDKMLQDRSSTCRFTPDSHLLRVSSEYLDLKEIEIITMHQNEPSNLHVLAPISRQTAGRLSPDTLIIIIMEKRTETLRRPAFRAPPSLTCCPGKNPNTPNRY